MIWEIGQIKRKTLKRRKKREGVWKAKAFPGKVFLTQKRNMSLQTGKNRKGRGIIAGGYDNTSSKVREGQSLKKSKQGAEGEGKEEEGGSTRGGEGKGV